MGSILHLAEAMRYIPHLCSKITHYHWVLAPGNTWVKWEKVYRTDLNIKETSSNHPSYCILPLYYVIIILFWHWVIYDSRGKMQYLTKVPKVKRSISKVPKVKRSISKILHFTLAISIFVERYCVLPWWKNIFMVTVLQLL